MASHDAFVSRTHEGPVDLLFLGDSITAGWVTTGQQAWTLHFGALRAADFGIPGDRTEHLLWRLQHGELDHIRPKAVVLLIGTNNLGLGRDKILHNTPAEVIEAVTAIVHELKERQPQAKILLIQVLPRGTPDDPSRQGISEANRGLAPLGSLTQVQVIDSSSTFAGKDGVIPTGLMPDGLHPSALGYARWAQVLDEPIARALNSP